MKLFWKLCGDHNLSGGVESRHAGYSATGGFPARRSNRAVDTSAAIKPTDFPSDSESSVSPAQKLKGDDSWIALAVALSPFIAAIVISIIHGLIT